MPNHVTNNLVISGPKKYRDAFMKTLQNKGQDEDVKPGTFCLAQTVPMPENIFRGNLCAADELKYPGEKNWYGWSCANWGTKWSNYNTSPVETTSRSIKVTFSTAWSPPSKWLETVSKQFPFLTFSDTWKDEGGPRGRIIAKNGDIQSCLKHVIYAAAI